MKRRFEMGVVVATPGALALGVNLIELLDRHARGDWGDLSAFDRRENDQALRYGARILSSYTLTGGRKVWIITEANRASTSILLPEEY